MQKQGYVYTDKSSQQSSKLIPLASRLIVLLKFIKRSKTGVSCQIRLLFVASFDFDIDTQQISFLTSHRQFVHTGPVSKNTMHLKAPGFGIFCIQKFIPSKIKKCVHQTHEQYVKPQPSTLVDK